MSYASVHELYLMKHEGQHKLVTPNGKVIVKEEETIDIGKILAGVGGHLIQTGASAGDKLKVIAGPPEWYPPCEEVMPEKDAYDTIRAVLKCAKD